MKKKSKNQKKGSALVIVLCISGLILLTSMSLSWVTGNMAYTSRNVQGGVQALALAEAGIADMLEKMSTNYVYWMDNSHSANFGVGSYEVTTVADTNTGNVVVRSVGTVGKSVRETAVELLGDLWTLYNSVLGADGCIISGGNVTLETSAMTINGGVHANGNVLNTTGNPTVHGDVSACGVVDVTPSAGHAATPSAGAVVVPDFRPFDGWKDLAQDGGIYYGADVVLPGVVLVPSNGVVYVDGDVEIGNRSGLVGTLVASGSITINNRFDQTPFNTNWPALLAGNDVALHNRNNYEGVIFAGGNVVSRNNKTLTGAIIAQGHVNVDNNMDLHPTTSPPVWDPRDTNQTPPQVIIGGWLQ